MNKDLPHQPGQNDFQLKEIDMDTISTSVQANRMVVIGVLFVLTLLSGLWVSNAGKPYNTWIFGFHKIFAMAAVIILGMRVVSLYKTLDIQSMILIAAIIAAALLLLALIVSGSLLSLDITLSGLSLKIHQIAPLVAVAASAITIYLLIGSKV
jgi:hypothetical protein